MAFYKLPNFIKFIFALTLVNVVLFSLFRVAFWLYFKEATAEPISYGALAQAFYVGFKFDLRLILIVLLPLFLLAWYRRFNPLYSNLARRFWLGYLSVTVVLLCLFYIFNFGHYAYLHTPLDATALRFLQNFDTSMKMIWQSYAVVWILLGLVFVIALYVFVLRRMIEFISKRPVYPLRKRAKVAVVAATFFITLFGLYGKLSWYPLRWSDAFAATHPFASAVTVNPVLYLFDTLKNRDVEFDVAATKAGYEHMVEFLGIDQPNKEELNFSRLQTANPLRVKQPNIVVVILESFANYKSSVSGNPIDPTPHIAAMAKDGIYFKNFFTPHAGTARSVFTAITGLPDVEKVKTSTRNPLIVNQQSIVNEFKGYEKLYFIGGSASWGNIRGLLSHNIPGLRLFEEGSYSSPRIDVWGISDLHLFDEANQVLRKVTGKPFFAVIQTSGNHRPYTIPDDNRGFVYQEGSEDEIKRYGFQSVAEFNSFRFMDHSIGYFIDAARRESYFDNTIFVFFGDHGINANAGEHSSKAESQLALGNIRVPLVFYAPKLLPKGKVYDKVASEVDVLPTLAGLATDSYINTTLGRDLFNPSLDGQRYAFTAINDYTMRIGLIDQEFYFRMNDDASDKVLHEIASESPRDNVIDQYPQHAAQMERLTRAIYESTRYIRYHNGRTKQTKIASTQADPH